MTKYLLFLIIFGLVLVNFSYAAEQITIPKTPSDVPGFKLFVKNLFEKGPGLLWNKMKEIFFNEVVPLWKAIHQKIQNFFQKKAIPKTQELIGGEIEKRKPELQEQFEKEKKETWKGIEDLKEKFKKIKPKLITFSANCFTKTINFFKDLFKR